MKKKITIASKNKKHQEQKPQAGLIECMGDIIEAARTKKYKHYIKHTKRKKRK